MIFGISKCALSLVRVTDYLWKKSKLKKHLDYLFKEQSVIGLLLWSNPNNTAEQFIT